MNALPVLDDSGAVVGDVNIKSAKFLVTHDDTYTLLHRPFKDFKLVKCGLVSASTTIGWHAFYFTYMHKALY